jgi:hypothetical protein
MLAFAVGSIQRLRFKGLHRLEAGGKGLRILRWASDEEINGPEIVGENFLFCMYIRRYKVRLQFYMSS